MKKLICGIEALQNKLRVVSCVHVYNQKGKTHDDLSSGCVHADEHKSGLMASSDNCRKQIVSDTHSKRSF